MFLNYYINHTVIRLLMRTGPFKLMEEMQFSWVTWK